MAEQISTLSLSKLWVLPELFAKAARRLEHRLAPVLGEHRIGNVRDLLLLDYLREHEGVNQKDAARAIGVDRNAMVVVLDRLEASSLVVRRVNPLNRREHRLQLTAAGRSNTERALKKLESALRNLPILSPDQRQLLVDWLLEITESSVS